MNALNSSTAVPLSAQLGGQIAGLHFHSGGAAFSNPSANPGTPTAFLQLQGLIAGNAHSGSNVVGSLEINTQQLDLDNFVEVIFTTTLQNRAGVWLNPALGSALFTAFDATGASLESVTGSAGNFVAVTRATNDIKFVSIVGGLSGFTIDDLTYGLVDSAPREVPEPGLALLLGLAVGLVRLVEVVTLEQTDDDPAWLQERYGGFGDAHPVTPTPRSPPHPSGRTPAAGRHASRGCPRGRGTGAAAGTRP